MAANNTFVRSAWRIMDELQNAGQMENALQSILEKLCNALDCTFDDIVEIVPEDK